MNRERIRQQILALCEDYAICLAEEIKVKEKKYIPVSGKSIGFEELSNMMEASLDMWLTAGRFNDEFEKAFAEKLGVKYVLTTNSGSSANLLALTALTSHKLKDRALKKGDEVICAAAGFPTTVNPIIQNGLVPVFVDCEIEACNIDVNKIKKSITPRTKAIFFAHALGSMCDMDKVMEIAHKYNLWVIEDSCDALGSRWKGKYAGTIGHVGTYSFYPAHHITMGEGGAVVTNDSALYRIIASFRDWGRDCWCKPGCDDTCHNRFNMKSGHLPAGYDHKYTYSHIGYNLKITDWQASVGLAQLKKLDKFLEIRENNAEALLSHLSDLQDYLILPKVTPNCQPSWFGFLISVKKDAPFSKLELITYLETHGVGTRQLFAGNILRQPMMVENEVNLRIEDSCLLNSKNLTDADYERLKGTEFVMNNAFWVGIAQNNTVADMEKISKVIHQFVADDLPQRRREILGYV